MYLSSIFAAIKKYMTCAQNRLQPLSPEFRIHNVHVLALYYKVLVGNYQQQFLGTQFKVQHCSTRLPLAYGFLE
jgi:hypothetical protein